MFSNLKENVKLKECIYQTKRINWPLGPLILSIESQHLPYIEEIHGRTFAEKFMREIQFVFVVTEGGSEENSI